MKKLLVVVLFLVLSLQFGGCRLLGPGSSDQVVSAPVVISGSIFQPLTPANRVVSPSVVAEARGNPLANVRVWIEEYPEYFGLTNENGSYTITLPWVAPNLHVVARIETGGSIWKNRSGQPLTFVGNAAGTDLTLAVATHFVLGRLLDEDGNPLSGLTLYLWGEAFPVGADGRFTSPPLPDAFSFGQIVFPGGGNLGAFAFLAPFISHDYPAFIETRVPFAGSDRNKPPTVYLSATLNGAPAYVVTSGQQLEVKATASDEDVADVDHLTPIWIASRGTLTGTANPFAMLWTAPAESGLATISVLVKDPRNGLATCSLPILVNRPADTTAPTVVLSTTAPNPTNAVIPVTVTFDEDVTDFVEGDVSLTNCTLNGFAATDAKNYSFNLVPIDQGEVKAEIAADKAHDAANNGSLAATPLTRTYDSVLPIVSAPTNAAQMLRAGEHSTSTVQSTKAGKIYLVKHGELAGTRTQIAAAITAGKAFLGKDGADAAAPYSVTLPTGLADGLFDLVAVDVAGNISAVVGGWLTVAVDYAATTNIGTLKYVPAGTFQRDATPANTSSVSAFRMSQHEITRAQFVKMLGTDPSETTAGSLGDDTPVQMAKWFHAIAFCNKLSIAEGLTPAYSVSGVNFNTLTYADIPTGDSGSWGVANCNWAANGYRLPTEMEWMWAAMGATSDSGAVVVSGVNTTGYSKTFAGAIRDTVAGWAGGLLDGYAWYSVNAGGKTQRVGTKSANELGILDLSGNVWEWCWDWYDPYPGGTTADYCGPTTGSYGSSRVLRGGSWSDGASYVPVAYRVSSPPDFQHSMFGFRVVRP